MNKENEMKAVIIAEKPSVARNIADALKIKTKKDGYYEGEEYLITWAFGHLLQLYDAKDYDSKMAKWKMENFPFIPEKFQYKVKSNPKNRDKDDPLAKKQVGIIKSLLFRKDVSRVISACDFDREGQLIGDSIIYNLKTTKEVYRLLLNEWTAKEVLAGLENVKPNSELRALQNAGVSRQWTDWVIGINLTSVATLKYQKGSGKAINIGRVLLPTLKIIYDRDKEIAEFKPEIYYKLQATFKKENGEQFDGFYVESEQEKHKEKQALLDAVAKIKDGEAFIQKKTVDRKKEYPPFLFNLSNLQGHITSKYKGFTADKVLKVAQSLYEKKYITYPRSESKVLDESLVERASSVLNAVKKGLPYEDEIKFVKSKRIFDSKKVESHSAIIPTYVVPKALTRDEEIVYNSIRNRFVMQFMKVAEHEETRLIVKDKDSLLKGHFLAKGRVQIVEGWRVVEKIESKDTILPFVNEGEVLQIMDTKLTDHVTQPPKHHTEKTLLRVMETCGKQSSKDEDETIEVLSGYSIGTAATRAETIKKLKDVGYIDSKDKYLISSELGRKLVQTFPVKELFDLQFTGRLEKALFDMEKGKLSRNQYLEVIYDFTKKSVESIKNDQDIILQEVEKQTRSNEVLGVCPKCKGNIVESHKGFGCSNWKSGCTYVIWKNDKFLAALKKKPTKTMVKELLKNNQVLAKGLTSKSGNKFDAIMKYEKNPENDYYSWKIQFEK